MSAPAPAISMRLTRRCARRSKAEPQGPILFPQSQEFAFPEARGIRFHDLRHTTASLLLTAGVPMAVVQKVLRHRDPRLTLQTYGHLANEFMASQVNRLHFEVSHLIPDRGGAQERLGLSSRGNPWERARDVRSHATSRASRAAARAPPCSRRSP
jgi:hypothetical protein